MAASFPPITNIDWWKGPNSFRLVYLILTVAVAACTALAVRQADWPGRCLDPKLRPTPRARFLDPATVAALLSAALFFALYVVVVFKWEDFADYDDAFFTLVTLKGHNLQPPIWPANGRFFPLGRQEFNALRHVTSSIVGYHVVPIAELLVVCGALFLLTAALGYPGRFAFITFVLVAPSIVVSFTGLVFPEIDVVLWLSLFLLAMERFESKRTTLWAVAACVCAQNMIYYKETAFLLVLGFAAGRLFLRCRQDGGWRFERLRQRPSRLDFCLLGVVLLFALYYSVAMHERANLRYASLQGVPRTDALLYYLQLDPLAVLLVAAVLFRIYLLFGRGAKPWASWDALAIGGVGFYAAYLYLRLCMPYYLAPVDVIALLYLARILTVSWNGAPRWGRLCVSALLCGLLSYNVSLSAFRLYERENMIHAKKRLADAILANVPSHGERPQTLFIPFVSPYVLSEFAAYLTFRGVHVATSNESGGAGPHPITIASERFSADGPCVDYMEFLCRAQSGPSPEDVVVELPDGLESQTEIDSYRLPGKRLLLCEPRPRVVQWIFGRLPYLHVISHQWNHDLPDRWLRASATVRE